MEGFAESKGISANADIAFTNRLKILMGTTLQNVSFTKNGKKEHQILTEKITGTWAILYKVQQLHLGIDYTDNVYGSMRLPLLGKLDPRKANSPVWSIQNIQFVYVELRIWNFIPVLKTYSILPQIKAIHLLLHAPMIHLISRFNLMQTAKY